MRSLSLLRQIFLKFSRLAEIKAPQASNFGLLITKIMLGIRDTADFIKREVHLILIMLGEQGVAIRPRAATRRFG